MYEYSDGVHNSLRNFVIVISCMYMYVHITTSNELYSVFHANMNF